VHILTKVTNFDGLMKKIQNLFFQKTVYNALCQHFLKARAPDQGLKPFLSPSKIAKRLEPSSPGFDPLLASADSSVAQWNMADGGGQNKARKEEEKRRKKKEEQKTRRG
jgi:hypothetical protein